MSNTILITGASGTIGRELTTVLKARHVQLVIGSSSGKTVAGLETRRTDFSDPDGLIQAFQGIDTLFLLLPLQSNMLELARNAVTAAKAAGVRHIVRSSGAGADPSSPFAIAKVQGEIDQLVINSGIAYTLTRPNNFMQNYVNFYGGMLRSGALYLAQGDGAISLIDARDIAAANAAILLDPASHAGKHYTLTGAQALTNTEVAAQVGAATGKSIQYVAVSDNAAESAMRDIGMDTWSIEIMTSLNQIITAGYAAAVSDDLSRLIQQPARSFQAFVSEHTAVWQ
ncbi:NmrA family NAD(P)-binding protein [Leeia oryzae]|uniref:NmrA family NAD(P)-binding protein n=1 Tax=Leeia oryzae TaxID=356662 RepID=UPI0003754D36|nr:NmrA family NAD(P)-binding protein [Leeia oryzae]